MSVTVNLKKVLLENEKVLFEEAVLDKGRLFSRLLTGAAKKNGFANAVTRSGVLQGIRVVIIV